MKKEIDADEQEAFIREVTEEVKNDNLKQMWEKYGIYIILLVVLAIVGAVSFEGFKSWRQAKSEIWSDTYAYALNLENQVKLASYKLDNAPREEIDALLQPLIRENGSWANIAKEMTAMAAIRDGNIEEAQVLYNEILNTPNLPDGLKMRVQDMLSVLNGAE